MRQQAVFTKVVKHLLTQKVRSCILSPSGMTSELRYRGPNGTKCAIGCLITDNEYHESMEGKDLELLLETDLPDRLYTRLYMHRMILRELQGIHDSCAPEEWKDKLQALGQRYQLKFPRIKE